jgi:hypothetical protein
MVVGETISLYRLLEKLDSGTNAASFLVEDQILGRNVVVQFLSEVLAGQPETLQRFVHEARSLAERLQLESSLLVAEQANGQPFLVLNEPGSRKLLKPLVELEDTTLRSLTREPPLQLSPGEATADVDSVAGRPW